MKIAFGSKADTLKALEGKLKHALVLPQLSATIAQFRQNPEAFWQTSSCPMWLHKTVIVRSSSAAEDNSTSSNAGKFESIANIKGKPEILTAIETVIDSYLPQQAEDQFFVQPMLENVVIAGVAFSQDPSSGGHFHVINFDDKTCKTDTVTAGTSNELKLAYVVKKGKCQHENPYITKIVNLLSELEEVFANPALDIEFAIDQMGDVYLLQVRPIVNASAPIYGIEQQNAYLEEASIRFRQMSKRHPYLLGAKTIFGVMPDWNPAEIIGTKPKPLSMSLYRELITDSIWAYQRDNYGYRKLRSFPLMLDFLGMPYIDARISFNSFIPAALKESTAEKLVNYYLSSLEASPFLHDKVEFDIVFSCYSFDLKERLRVLSDHGFDVNEQNDVFETLKTLTNKIIGSNGLWRKDIEKIRVLENKQGTILNSELSHIDKIYWLLEDCKRYGTLPFAGLARAGFIAVQMLDSMVQIGVLSAEEREQFLRSLDTVSTGLSNDLGTLSQEKFLNKYGHLRPGTYDILSPRYDEEPDSYFDWKKERTPLPAENNQFAVTIEALNQLNEILKADGIDQDAIGLFNFIRAAIEGREYAKFVFTKSLSDVLALTGLAGAEEDFDLNDMSYAEINLIKDSYVSARSFSEELNRNIAMGKEKYQITQQLRLPPLLVSERDFWAFTMPSNQPNYVTQKTCRGKVLPYTKSKRLMTRKIVFIENADPGYDWIFSTNICGFVTQYGGINSHMAIRAAELGIPAVIGAGETLFKQWLASEYLEIDCANKTVRLGA